MLAFLIMHLKGCNTEPKGLRPYFNGSDCLDQRPRHYIKRNALACFVMHSMVGGTIMQSKGALINNTKYGHEHYISPTNQSH